jgi:phage gp46-like protein
MKLIPLDTGMIDLALNAVGRLSLETTLQTAVIVSLLTDRRAEADDRLPFLVKSERPIPADRKGWAGDGFGGQRIGSRLWLLQREKQTPETLRRAVFYSREALQWMIDDEHVVSIDISAAWTTIGRLDISIRLQLPGGGTFETLIPTGVVYAL